MKKVLVAFDGSDPAGRALQYVLDLPEAARPAEIHLVNVQEWSMVYSDYMTPMLIDQIQESQMASGGKALEPAAGRVAAAKLAYQTHVLVGNIGQAIADQADKLGCDHIVMGSRGLGVLKGLFVGSVATRVIQLSKIPVTLVK